MGGDGHTRGNSRAIPDPRTTCHVPWRGGAKPPRHFRNRQADIHTPYPTFDIRPGPGVLGAPGGCFKCGTFAGFLRKEAASFIGGPGHRPARLKRNCYSSSTATVSAQGSAYGTGCVQSKDGLVRAKPLSVNFRTAHPQTPTMVIAFRRRRHGAF